MKRILDSHKSRIQYSKWEVALELIQAWQASHPVFAPESILWAAFAWWLAKIIEHTSPRGREGSQKSGSWGISAVISTLKQGVRKFPH